MFAAAAVLALAHAFDDAVLARGPGVSLTQHGLALLIAVAATVVAVVRFESMRPGLARKHEHQTSLRERFHLPTSFFP